MNEVDGVVGGGGNISLVMKMTARNFHAVIAIAVTIILDRVRRHPLLQFPQIPNRLTSIWGVLLETNRSQFVDAN